MLLPQGVSVASGSGPVVVAPRPMSRDDFARIEIAAPETMPTELLVLRMCLGDVRHREVPSGEILEEVRSGRAGAAILPQAAAGLTTCVDRGPGWQSRPGKPRSC